MGVEDYDYWMRINNAFSIQHLGTDELLYSYRVHDNTLSIQLNHGRRIFELVDGLIDYERGRSAYCREPWTIRADNGMRLRLAGKAIGPHRLTAWTAAGHGPVSVPVPAGGAAGAAEDRPADRSLKILYLVETGSLPGLARQGVPEGAVVAAWFASIESVYERRLEAVSLAQIAFTAEPAVAQRLDLLGVPTMVVAEPTSLASLAILFANTRSFFERTRPEALRQRTLPRVFQAPGVRKRVLFQFDNFDQGGLENVALSLAQGLEAQNLEVALLVLGRLGPAAEQARRLGVPVLTLPPSGREEHYRALLKEQQIALVVAHYSIYGAAIAAAAAIPFVQVVQNSYVWLSPGLIAAYRAADPFTTAYVCVSTEVAYYCDCALGLSVEKMVVIPNGVDVQALSAAPISSSISLRKELGIEAEDLVYLNVASIHGVKAQIPLIKAMKTVVQTHPRARLVLTGPVIDPRYAELLEEQIARLRLESTVVLAGSRQDIPRFYRMADLFVLPSYWEGWSLALTEAVCAGLPVVATDVGGARELVMSAGGHLVKPPFASITELNRANIVDLALGDHPRFVAELAQRMVDAAKDPVRRSVPVSLRHALGQAHATLLHARLYHWLIRGGRPDAARAWCRPPAGHVDLGEFPLPERQDHPAGLEANRSGSYRIEQAEIHKPARGGFGGPADTGSRPETDDASESVWIRHPRPE
jgi:glycosyltransferase involved in cell wall biosynthesis